MKKVRNLWFLILLIFSTSCAGITTPRLTTKIPGTDKEFEPYIREYKYMIDTKIYDKRFKNLSMNFSKLEGNTVGTCWWLLNGDLEIEIDSTHWRNGTIIDRQFLAYHELEHCIRQRMHTNRVLKINSILDLLDEIGYYIGIITKKGTLPDGCPASLMHSHTMSWRCQQKHFQFYIDEIRNWRK